MHNSQRSASIQRLGMTVNEGLWGARFTGHPLCKTCNSLQNFSLSHSLCIKVHWSPTKRLVQIRSTMTPLWALQSELMSIDTHSHTLFHPMASAAPVGQLSLHHCSRGTQLRCCCCLRWHLESFKVTQQIWYATRIGTQMVNTRRCLFNPALSLQLATLAWPTTTTTCCKTREHEFSQFRVNLMSLNGM